MKNTKLEIEIEENTNEDLKFILEKTGLSLNEFFSKSLYCYIDANSGLGKFKFQDVPSFKK